VLWLVSSYQLKLLTKDHKMIEKSTEECTDVA
jgi:hypothetical protein